MKDWEAAYIAGIIDGEGSISLTRMHEGEHRRPCLSIASTDKELLIYIQSLTGGLIVNKKNFNPEKHKDSYTLIIKKKDSVMYTLNKIFPYLRVERKKNRARLIIDKYDLVTPRNGKYDSDMLQKKLSFERLFFQI